MEAQDSRKRRRYIRELKAQILAECEAPGASVAKAALGHGINANIEHGWRKLARHVQVATAPQSQFVAVSVAPAPPVQVDGIGVWLAARRLNSGKFVWPKDEGGTLTLSRAQFDALVLGLPWQRIGEAGVITVL